MGSVEDTETGLVDGDGDSSRVAQRRGVAAHAEEVEGRKGSESEVQGEREERQQAEEMASPPRDRYWLSWFIFCLLGMGCLLPWNFFISGTAIGSQNDVLRGLDENKQDLT